MSRRNPSRSSARAIISYNEGADTPDSSPESEPQYVISAKRKRNVSAFDSKKQSIAICTRGMNVRGRSVTEQAMTVHTPEWPGMDFVPRTSKSAPEGDEDVDMKEEGEHGTTGRNTSVSGQRVLKKVKESSSSPEFDETKVLADGFGSGFVSDTCFSQLKRTNATSTGGMASSPTPTPTHTPTPFQTRANTPSKKAGVDLAHVLQVREHVRRLTLQKNYKCKTSVDIVSEEKVLDELNDEKLNRLYHTKVDLGKEKYERDQLALSVIVTGARPGEILRGVRDKTRNAVIRIDTLIPPSAKRLLSLHNSRESWSSFLARLSSIAFFYPLSLDERADWLVEHAMGNEMDLADVPGLRVDFSSLGSGSSAFLTRSEDQMCMILSASEKNEDSSRCDVGAIAPMDVLEMFTNKPGSGGLRGRPTLVWLRQYWQVDSTHVAVDTYTGTCVSVSNGKVTYGASVLDSPSTNTEEKNNKTIKYEPSYATTEYKNPGYTNTKNNSSRTILLFSGFLDNGDDEMSSASKTITSGSKSKNSSKKKNREDRTNTNVGIDKKQSVGFMVDTRVLPMNQAEALRVAGVSHDDFTKLNNSLEGFTAAGYKSLLQKIIRARPRNIELLDHSLLDARTVLSTCVALLFVHPGSFVPDIQRYVTGAESALKRVAVSVCEDSFTDNHDSVLSLLAAAWVAQASARLWRPGAKELKRVLQVAMNAWEEDRQFLYSYQKQLNSSNAAGARGTEVFTISSCGSALENASAILDRLRSFEGDLYMLRDIARNGGKPRPSVASSARKYQPESLSILHAVDQHWCPDFVYFLPPKCVEELNKTTANASARTPFKNLFTRVQNLSSGVNTRTTPLRTNNIFLRQLRRAQFLGLSARATTYPTQRPINKEKWSTTYTLERAWIAGLVGALEVSLTKPATAALVTLRPDDPKQLVAFRRPSRDSARKSGGSENGLTDEQEEQAKSIAREMLRKGVKLDKSSAPIRELQGATLKYEPVDDIPHLVRRRIPCNGGVYMGMASNHTDSTVVGESEDESEGEDTHCIFNTMTQTYLDASLPETEFARYVVVPTTDYRDFAGDWETIRKDITHTYDIHPSPNFPASKVYAHSLKCEYTDGGNELGTIDTVDRLTIAITTCGDGVETESKVKMSTLIRTTPASHIKRAFSVASAFASAFSFPGISRDGGGTELQPSLDDIGAFQFLLTLSTLYPGIFQHTAGQITSFSVGLGPGFWRLRDECLGQLKALSGKPDVSTHNTTTNFPPQTTKHSAAVDFPHFSDQRTPHSYQMDAVIEMQNQHTTGRRGHFLYLPVGLGKTKIVMDYASWLRTQDQLPRTVLWTLPSSALESVRNEMRFYNLPVRILWPIKRPVPSTSSSKVGSLKSSASTTEYYRGHELMQGGINFVSHDHLRLLHDSLVCGSGCEHLFFVVDEVHKALNATQRTASALEIARLAKEFVALTGTPIIDNNTYKLMWWLEHIVPFEVNTRNFWAAAGAMVSKRIALGIETETIQLDASFTKNERDMYHELVSPALGGANTSFSERDFRSAMSLCYTACTRVMIKETKRLVLEENEGVMLVAKDASHQARLIELLVGGNGSNGDTISRKRVFAITGQESINYTPLTKKLQYDVVITTMRHVEGYSLTALRHMVTCVYPSNNASREQIEGRMVRVGQPSPTVFFHLVCSGLLYNILRSHEDARSLSDVLKSLATVVDVPPPSLYAIGAGHSQFD
eukprot:CFRG2103T1